MATDLGGLADVAIESGGLPDVAMGSGDGEAMPLVLPLVLPRLGTDSKALLLAALLMPSGSLSGDTMGKA